MAQLDPGIILAGQGVNALGAIAAGNEAAAFQKNAMHQDAYRNMLAQNGAGIMAGDQGALNALAGYDPSAALGIQNTRQDMQFAQQRMDILTEQERRNAEEYARGLSADQAAAEAAQLEGAVKQALMLPDAASWDAFMTQNGMTDLVGQYDNRQALAGKYMSMAEVLKQAFPEPADPTSTQSDYAFYVADEARAGRAPLGFNDWELQRRKAGANSTTLTVGGATKEELAAHNADVKADNVSQVIADIRSSDAGATLPTTGFFGSLLSGVSGTAAHDISNNLDTLRAAASFGSLQAMRAASPTGGALGAVSDTEVKLLQSELASLEQSQSEEQFWRNLDRFEKTYMEIVHGPQGGKSNPPPDGPVQITDKAQYDALPSGAEFIAPDGTTRRKP